MNKRRRYLAKRRRRWARSIRVPRPTGIDWGGGRDYTVLRIWDECAPFSYAEVERLLGLFPR